ncbi:dTDP-4-dehydrorhamnose reductase [Tropicimonas sp. IMCC34043]|uniref:dTDP-4-dehydrorhamnose reductase n=1 Tax=Tropicimonas sp. IMCC34043 TaxID=2248760 RepID=UPI000E272700|nr:dTDP-4-dehydrorhamnose reductase [Tropicimonas sp. IMCC34043]
MKALVFGRTGQVATELQLQAPGRGIELIVLGREAADLSRPESCAEAIATAPVDAVINAAAHTAVDRAETEQELALAINGAAPAAMARACASRGLPFLHVSTDYVFDGSGTAPWKPDDATGPLGAYGRTKLAGEQGIAAAGGRYAILRTSWVFSAHGANFVKTMLRLAETRSELNVVADQIGGPTPAAAIAAALLEMAGQMAADRRPGGIHHFSGTPDASWADFARAIFAEAGKAVTVNDIPAASYPTPAARPGNSRMDCASLEARFGIPRPDWRAGLRDVLGQLAAQTDT